MGSKINHCQLKVEKLVIKKIKFRDAKGNEIKELNYLVDYIDNSIEKYIEGKHFSVQQSQQKMESLLKRIITLVIIQTCGQLQKNIRRKIINKRSKKTTKCYGKKVYRVV